jgi:uncharacterized protein (DUF58 family)
MLDRELLKKIRRIAILTRRQVDETFAGQYRSVFRGRGMEFDEVREYSPGDDVRAIDWNVTARMGHPYIKQFTEERELTVILMVDLSASGLFGSTGVTKRQAAAEVGAILAFSAIRTGDKVGLILFTDRIELYVPPAKGNRHGMRVIREMLSFRPEGKSTDTAGALDYLSRVQKKKAVVFCIGDYFDGGFDRSLKLASRRHDLVAVPVIDPREESIPRIGLIELEDAETGRTVWVDSSDTTFARAYERRAKLRRQSLETQFIKSGVDSIFIDAGADPAGPLVRFFKKREARIR